MHKPVHLRGYDHAIKGELEVVDPAQIGGVEPAGEALGG